MGIKYFQDHSITQLKYFFHFLNKVWDYYSGDLICDLKEHTAEISACQFNYSGTQIVTSSIDKTCKLWDIRNTSKSLATFIGHSDEIIDVTFNLTGTRIASASSDHTAKIYNTKTLLTEYTLTGKHFNLSQNMKQKFQKYVLIPKETYS